MDFWMQQLERKERNKKRKVSTKKTHSDRFSYLFPHQNRFDLGVKYPGIYFTRREMQSVYYLIQGMTMKESAHHMRLSPRTVEFYLGNVKQKMECNRKTILIKKLQSTPLWALMTSSGYVPQWSESASESTDEPAIDF